MVSGERERTPIGRTSVVRCHRGKLRSIDRLDLVDFVAQKGHQRADSLGL
jgi:hypothetical protein